MLSVVAFAADSLWFEIVSSQGWVQIDIILLAYFLSFGLLHYNDIIYNRKEHIFNVIST
jgi:hypothetical protein